MNEEVMEVVHRFDEVIAMLNSLALACDAITYECDLSEKLDEAKKTIQEVREEIYALKDTNNEIEDDYWWYDDPFELEDN